MGVIEIFRGMGKNFRFCKQVCFFIYLKVAIKKACARTVCLWLLIFCHCRPFFALLPHHWPRKLKFGKNVRNTRRYYPFTQVYHKSRSYDVWFLRNKVQRTEFFVILGHFYPLTLLKLWLRDVQFLIYGARRADGRTEGWTVGRTDGTSDI